MTGLNSPPIFFGFDIKRLSQGSCSLIWFQLCYTCNSGSNLFSSKMDNKEIHEIRGI